MKQERVRHKVPPELIAEYEEERTEVRLDLADIAAAKEPDGPVEMAEWFLLDSDLHREHWKELAESVTVELRQRKGTKMLYVIEVDDEGNVVRIRASDGSHGAQAVRPAV
jgi:hypothetical protein